jgi:hypothetical protein
MRPDTPKGVYYQDQDSTGEPAYYVTQADAKTLIAADKAWSINSGRDIRLKEYVETMTAEGLEGELGVPFVNRYQSRNIREHTMDRAVGIVADKKLGPFLRERLLMHGGKRKKPLAVVAVESWA